MSKIVSAALVSVLALLTNADRPLAKPETLERHDQGFTARLVLREDTQMLDAVRWGLNGDRIRWICPFCDYMELRSDILIWLPFPVTWDEEADRGAAGALTFHRPRAFEPEMIEEMLFTANKRVRPLRAGSSSLQVDSAMTRE